jgi:hypothetical protein
MNPIRRRAGKNTEATTPDVGEEWNTPRMYEN